MTEASVPRRVVIVGGGFAGLFATRMLAFTRDIRRERTFTIDDMPLVHAYAAPVGQSQDQQENGADQ